MDELIEQQQALISELQRQLTADANRHAPNIGIYSESLSRAVQDLDMLKSLARVED